MARLWRLAREGVAIAGSQPLVSSVVALIVGALCALLIAVTGQSVAQERAALARIDQAGTRSLVVIDRTGEGLPAGGVERLRALTSVEWVVGVGPVFDVRNAALGGGGERTPARLVVGPMPHDIEITVGRWPAVGEAIVPVSRLRAGLSLEHPSGSITDQRGRDFPVVGAFVAGVTVPVIGQTILIGADDSLTPQTVILVTRDAAAVGAVLPAVLDLVGVADLSDLAVETSEALAEVRAAVSGALSEHARRIAAGFLVGGGLLTALVVASAAAVRRREHGLRRALGASRLDVFFLVTLQTFIAATLGAFVGSAVGLVAAGSGTAPDATFVVAAMVLAILTAVLAALIPAAVTAFRDPVEVLRLP